MRSWDGIDEFLAVAAAGSFTKGAARINMSPTHVSRAIMALEQRLDTRLFHRTTRTVHLTDTGRALHDRLARIVQDREEAFALIASSGEPQGTLRVTCSTAMGERFVAPILRRFAMRHKRLDLNIELSNHLVDLVEENFDLGIRTGTIRDPRLLATRVAARTLYTCAAPEYLARRGHPTSIDDLAGHDCIVGTSAAWHFNFDDRLVTHNITGRFRCNSGQAVIDACVAGLGICQLPDFYILPFLKHGMVTLVLEEYRPPNEPIWAVYGRHRHLLPKVQQAVDALSLELGPAMNRPS